MKIITISRLHSILTASAMLVVAGCSSLQEKTPAAAPVAPSVNAQKESGVKITDGCAIEAPENKLDESTLALVGTKVFAYDCVIPQGMGCITWCETTLESRMLLFASEYIFAANKGDKISYPTLPVAFIRHDPDVVTGNKTGKGTVSMAWNIPSLLGANRIFIDDYPFKNLTTASYDRPIEFPLKCSPGKVYNLCRMEAKTGKGEKLKLSVYCAFFPQDSFKGWCGGGYFDNYDQFSLDTKSVDAIRKELGLTSGSSPATK